MNRRYTLAVILLISLALRFRSIGISSYWIDEMVSIHFASHPNWGALFWDNTPFLYHLLLKGWVYLFGTHEVVTRLLSALFSTTATLFLVNFGFRLYGLKGILVFAGLHAFSPLSITYAQETRPYALFELATVLNFICLYDLVNSDDKTRKPRGWKYLATVILLCLTHYLSLLILIPELVWLAFLNFKEKKLEIPTKFLVGGAVIASGTILASYIKFFSWHHLRWQTMKFTVEADSHWPTLVLWTLLGESYFSLIGMFFLLGLATYFAWRDSIVRGRISPYPVKVETKFAGFLLAATASALILMTVYSQVAKRSVFLPRYFIFLLPAIIIAAGIGWCEWRPKKGWAWLPLGFLVAGTFFSFPLLYQPRKAPWREVAGTIASVPGSIVLTTRSLGIRSPYFDELHIPVEKWEPAHQGFVYLNELLGKWSSVWILENFWGASYYEKLTAQLKEKGLKTENYSAKTELSEPIMVLRVEKPSNPLSPSTDTPKKAFK